MIKKVVWAIENEQAANDIRKELLDHDLADFRLIKLGNEYEQIIRQEIFLSSWEWRTSMIGALIGAVLGAILLPLLTLSGSYALLPGWILASGLRTAIFVGAGAGLALGGLTAGLYALSRPLPHSYTGQWLLVLFCNERGSVELARTITAKHGHLLS